MTCANGWAYRRGSRPALPIFLTVTDAGEEAGNDGADEIVPVDVVELEAGEVLRLLRRRCETT